MDSVTAKRAGALFEAVLLQTVLEPLAQSADMLGSYGASCLSESIARNDTSGFGAEIAKILERRDGR